jgi:Mrp family chromosome partitioning ATPase
MNPGEQILACTAIRREDPSASFSTDIALAFVHLGHSPVLVVDANFAESTRPAQAESPAEHSGEVFSIQQSTAAGLDVLSFTGGLGSIYPVLSSPRMGSLLEQFRKYRFAILDVGSVLESTASLMIASKADACFAVASTGSATRRDIARLKAETSLLTNRFLGVVLTETE